MSDDQFGPNVSAIDMDAVRVNTGKNTSRIFVQIEGQMLRVNLGEMISGQPVYHTAAIIPAVDAVGYADLLKEMALRAVAAMNAAPQQWPASDGE